jgi:hypothetical protein
MVRGTTRTLPDSVSHPLLPSRQKSHDLRLEDARRRSSGLLITDTFQRLERAVDKDWLCIMGTVIEKTTEKERNRDCRRALRHQTSEQTQGGKAQ